MATVDVDVDVVVVGGGIQGLTVLRELDAQGYASVLVTDASLGAGQTLHSHGSLTSGTALVTGGGLREAVRTVTVPYLRRLGVPVHDEEPSFLVIPDPMVDDLGPVWQANGYRPERTARSVLAGFEPGTRPFRVHAYNVGKRRMVEGLSHGLERFILEGEIVEVAETIHVRMNGGEGVRLHPRAMVVAAGCGTKALLRDRFGVDGSILDRITYSKMHMICLRAPAAVLPTFGAVVSPDLLVVGHRQDGDHGTDEGDTTWFVTPVDPAAAVHAEAPGDADGDVEPRLVALGVEALRRFFPVLRGDHERVRATVFAGYKQNLDGQPTKRACELVDADRNLVVALPSVLANAVPNALDAVAILRQRVEPRGRATQLPDAVPPRVGEPNEDRSTSWHDWASFIRSHGG